MIDSLFAVHQEFPVKLVTEDNIEYKEFFGSASEFNKGEKRYVEGKRELIKVRGNTFNTLQEMTEDLQSAISYVGATDINAIKK